MVKPEYRPLAQMVVTASADGLASIVVSHTGQVWINGEPLDKPKQDARRKWALSQALAYANAKPELNLSPADITELADKFLDWLDKKPRQNPPAAPPPPTLL